MKYGKSLLAQTLAVSLFPCALAFGAAPIERNGPCPTLARYTPSDVNWGSTFGIRPSPTSQYPTGTVQHPLSPDSSINCLQVPAGLKAQLIASERMTPGLNSALPMAYLMNFTFDERGRTWAVEPRDYPYMHNDSGLPDIPGWTAANGGNGLPSPSSRGTAGRGRILILTDVDGDGSLDNYKVFYTGLALPTSLELVKGGVIATVPPYVYFIAASTSNPDTAGAAPVAVVSGMGSTGNDYDTHGQTNSLTAGIDNFIYGHAGGMGCGSPTVGPNAGVSCGGGNIYRFKATAIGSDTNLFQIHSNSGPANAHGIGQTEDGQWFKSGATGSVRNTHQVRHGTGGTTVEISKTYWPITQDRYLWEGSTSASDAYGKTTTTSATSGHDFYTATLLPRKYRRFAFMCEGASKLCNQDSLVENGSTWTALRMPGPVASNIFASTDAWTAPLKVRTGPDGALWVLDWYNYLFLHNPAGPSTNTAWRNSLRAKSRVRLYRLIPSDGSTQPLLNLSNATVPQLLSVLGHSNMVWRLQAQRLLLNRAYGAGEREALLDSLQKILLTNFNVEDAEFGTSPKVLHALWTVAGMKPHTFNVDATRWDSTFKKLLVHPAWTVRRNALLALPATVASAEAIKSQCAVNDVHAHVRVQALATLIRLPAPASGAAEMVATYRNTDTHSTGAFTAAGTKVTEIAGTERPSTCPAYNAPVAVAPQNARDYASRKDLRFQARDGGFLLGNNLQLGSGELSVTDLRGKVVFRSTYNAGTKSWSNPSARDLVFPVYFYTFREVGGASFNGRIALSPAF
jgi:putative membrane-bound dehydrogenase-like protein